LEDTRRVKRGRKAAEKERAEKTISVVIVK
jgi:hypothetical protein